MNDAKCISMTHEEADQHEPSCGTATLGGVDRHKVLGFWHIVTIFLSSPSAWRQDPVPRREPDPQFLHAYVRRRLFHVYSAASVIREPGRTYRSR